MSPCVGWCREPLTDRILQPGAGVNCAWATLSTQFRLYSLLPNRNVRIEVPAAAACWCGSGQTAVFATEGPPYTQGRDDPLPAPPDQIPTASRSAVPDSRIRTAQKHCADFLLQASVRLIEPPSDDGLYRRKHNERRASGTLYYTRAMARRV
jgi:hypothetical protein